ncbi:MAG: hypothetical protein IPN76_31620 [Saprospiraceae bacterium]|jgi:hypothetical protein|nr:hypothetical protein [Saprospiraceae bacterium]
MMRNLILLFIFASTAYSLHSQQSTNQGRLTLNVKYGLAYSFFVEYEQAPEDVPPGFIAFYNKKRIGNIGGIGLSYSFNEQNGIGVYYERQVHVGRKSFNGMASGANLSIKDFKLRHTNNFFGLDYHRNLFSSNELSFNVGVYLLFPEQQEISLFDNFIDIGERNNKNSNLMEGGVTLGFKYLKDLPGNFRLGVETKAFYTASLVEFETISVTPVLAYDF